MLKDSVARRYSTALFALASEANAIDATVKELDAFVTALSEDPALEQFFESPVVDRGTKQQILTSALSGANDLVRNFVILLARKRRENLIRIIARQMHELLDRHAGIERAAIDMPAPPQPAELEALTRRLSELYKKTIVPQVKVQPDLLGGIIVQVGDRYVDASVSGKLEELRRHLLATTDTWPATSTNGKRTVE